jgi:hypothetical protein
MPGGMPDLYSKTCFDSVKKQQFTFSKVLSNQGSAKKVSVTEPAKTVQ